MGDRSNIVVQEANGNRVWLYGHWMGEDSIRIVRNVLDKRERWEDAPYLARMLFGSMIAGDLAGSTSYGISTTMCDNEYPIIILEPHTQTAWLEVYIWGEGGRYEQLTKPISFEDFLEALSFSEDFNNLAVNMGSKIVPV
jgi:hypothetical protein